MNLTCLLQQVWKPRVAISSKGDRDFCVLRESYWPQNYSNLLMVRWAISGARDKYLRNEDSGELYYIRKVTGPSGMTFKFVIFTDLSEIETDKQEEELREFFWSIFTDLHTQLKGLNFLSIYLFYSWLFYWKLSLKIFALLSYF